MYTTPDRRAKPRIVCDFPAIVEGTNGRGLKYEEQAKLANLSAGGLYMLLDQYIEPGSKLAVTVHLCGVIFEKDATKLVTRGIVVRTEPQMNGQCGVAVQFQSYRFL